MTSTHDIEVEAPATQAVERYQSQVPPRRMSNEVDRKAVLAEMRGQVQLLEEALKDLLKEGMDYGHIPGTSGKSRSLWQPGAEKLRFMFDLSAPTEIINRHEDWQNGVFSYDARCLVLNNQGRELTRADSTCSTEEVKYKQQQESREVTFRNGDKKTYPARPAAEFRQVCVAMAQKRAFVAAIKRVAGASEFFSQDDDLEVDRDDWRDRDRPAKDPTKGTTPRAKRPDKIDPQYGECLAHEGWGWTLSQSARDNGYGPSHFVSKDVFCQYDDVKRQWWNKVAPIVKQRFGHGADASRRFEAWLANMPELDAALPNAMDFAAYRPVDWKVLGDYLEALSAAEEAAEEDSTDGPAESDTDADNAAGTAAAGNDAAGGESGAAVVSSGRHGGQPVKATATVEQHTQGDRPGRVPEGQARLEENQHSST